MQKNDVRHAMLKGTAACITRAVREYRSGSIKVLLMNPAACGHGLNLQDTTHLILLNPLDVDMERHAMGRALRVGKSSPLTVWKLLYSYESASPCDDFSFFQT